MWLKVQVEKERCGLQEFHLVCFAFSKSEWTGILKRAKGVF